MDQPFLMDQERFSHKGWNWHSVQDNGIIECAMDDYFDNSQELFEFELTHVIEMANGTGNIDYQLACADRHDKKCVSSWAEEPFDDALTWAYKNSNNNQEVVHGSVLDDLYYETRVPVVKRKTAAAGVHLAYILELVLTKKAASWLSTWEYQQVPCDSRNIPRANSSFSQVYPFVCKQNWAQSQYMYNHTVLNKVNLLYDFIPFCIPGSYRSVWYFLKRFCTKEIDKS